jgi:hypothetical protein
MAATGGARDLADLEPGQEARMAWLSFEVCVSWPATHEGKKAR